MARRRGRGEGSITQRADGRWMGRVETGWKNGKRTRKAVYGRTRQEVAEKIRKALDQVDDGIPFPDERQTTGQFLQSWLATKQQELRPRAYCSYEQTIHEHIEPGIGRVPLAKLAPQHVATWFRKHQTEDGASARTIRYARAVLRSALNQALRWGMVTRNAAQLVTPPRYRPREIQPLTPEQARTLLHHVSGHRLEPLVTAGVALGLRLGEILGLRWRDVDLQRGMLSVTQALERSGGDPQARRRLNAERRDLKKRLNEAADPDLRDELRTALAGVRKNLKEVRAQLRFTEPKTERSRRTVTLPVTVVDALRQHRTNQKKERLAAGGDWRDSGLVFTTSIGTPLDARNVHREFKAVLASADLPLVRFHDLRHTAATLLLAQGVDPRTIMETLGHSQISLTLNTYSHVVPALQKDAAAKMDAILTR